MAIRRKVIVTTCNVTRVFTSGDAASRYVLRKIAEGKSPNVTSRYGDMRAVPKETRRDYYRRTHRLAG